MVLHPERPTIRLEGTSKPEKKAEETTETDKAATTTPEPFGPNVHEIGGNATDLSEDNLAYTLWKLGDLRMLIRLKIHGYAVPKGVCTAVLCWALPSFSSLFTVLAPLLAAFYASRCRRSRKPDAAEKPTAPLPVFPPSHSNLTDRVFSSHFNLADSVFLLPLPTPHSKRPSAWWRF